MTSPMLSSLCSVRIYLAELTDVIVISVTMLFTMYLYDHIINFCGLAELLRNIMRRLLVKPRLS